MKRAWLVLIALFLAACGRERGEVRTQYLPGEVIRDEVKYYVEIDDELLAKCRWTPNVPPSKTLEAARRRAECLEQYEGQLDEIGRIRGTAAPLEDTSDAPDR